MPTVTPSPTLPQPPLASAPASKPAAPTLAPLSSSAAAPAPAPSATVSLSAQAMTAANHPATAASAPATPAPVSMSQDGSVYEALKGGIATAVVEVEDTIASGAHAVVDGVENALSTANKVVKGALELPFAAVAKACDGAGALIDEL